MVNKGMDDVRWTLCFVVDDRYVRRCRTLWDLRLCLISSSLR